MEIRQEVVDDVPLIFAEPETPARRRLVIWNSGFSGSRWGQADQLKLLAEAGFFAVSYDAFQHGDRRIEPQEQLGPRVFGNFRKFFWPIIARSAQDASKVIDWAIKRLGVEKQVGIGGVSMGGDIAVTAAGMDERIVSAVACIATPDWKRPGTDIGTSQPDAAAQADYDNHCPIMHPEHYAKCPAILFLNGANDIHVPPEAAVRFETMLKPIYTSHPERLRVMNYENVGHDFTPKMWDEAFAWFKRF